MESGSDYSLEKWQKKKKKRKERGGTPREYMNARIRATSKGTRLAEIALVVFVAIVLVALYYSYLPGTSSSSPSTQSNISLQNITLFSGSASAHSLSSSCKGDATLEVVFVNPASTVLHISNVVIYGTGLARNATTLVSISNSCLSLSESDPVINGGSTTTFDGYVDTPLPFGSSFHYFIRLDNGQNFTGILQAQS